MAGFRRWLRTLAGGDDADNVRALADRAHRLENTGQTAEALVAWQECCRRCRELTAADQDAHRPKLAEVLGHVARLLQAADRPAEALAAAGESAELWHELALDDPERHLQMYAGAASNLALMLAEAGRAEEALPLADEAVRIHRKLDDPHTLPVVINTRGLVLNRLGRATEARDAFAEAMELYSRLVEALWPYKEFLAMTAHNLSLATLACGNREAALELNLTSVRLYEELARWEPDTFSGRLAAAREDLALLRAEMGAEPTE